MPRAARYFLASIVDDGASFRRPDCRAFRQTIARAMMLFFRHARDERLKATARGAENTKPRTPQHDYRSKLFIFTRAHFSRSRDGDYDL